MNSKFGADLAQLINAHVQAETSSVEEVILVLEMTKIDMATTVLAHTAMKREAKAADQAPKIVGLNGEVAS